MLIRYGSTSNERVRCSCLPACLQVAAAEGWRQFQAAVATEYYDGWARLVAALGTLDCLLSLAALAQLPGYCRPTLLPPTADTATDGGGDAATVAMNGDGDDNGGHSIGAASRRRPAAAAPVGLKIVAGRHPTVEALLPTAVRGPAGTRDRLV